MENVYSYEGLVSELENLRESFWKRQKVTLDSGLLQQDLDTEGTLEDALGFDGEDGARLVLPAGLGTVEEEGDVGEENPYLDKNWYKKFWDLCYESVRDHSRETENYVVLDDMIKKVQGMEIGDRLEAFYVMAHGKYGWAPEEAVKNICMVAERRDIMGRYAHWLLWEGLHDKSKWGDLGGASRAVMEYCNSSRMSSSEINEHVRRNVWKQS